MNYSVITGSGSYIPTCIQSNEDFLERAFYSEGQLITSPAKDVIEKFRQITGIEQRRYVTGELLASDLGTMAGLRAIRDSGINKEEIDQLIVAHNFGNVRADNVQSVAVPSLASLVKHQLGIENPSCIAYDLLFGCPGWLQGMIQADAFFRAGVAKKALVIGTETLSRVIDRFDRDSMIFSDGAGAVVMEYSAADSGARGILSFSMQSHALQEVNYIHMDISSDPDGDPHVQYIKMQGRKVYEYALSHVPGAMKDCMDKSGVPVGALKKIFLHQANEKMDEAIISRFYKLYGLRAPADIMPMSIQWLGNSSVATIPTLFDLVCKKQLASHTLVPGDVILFASVGAGMNINAVCYQY